MVSRDSKRIASRSTIRLMPLTATGLEQRCAILLQTGVETGTGNTIERLDAVSMAARNTHGFNRHIDLPLAILTNNRVRPRMYLCLEPRMRMQASSRLKYYGATGIDKRIGNPINMRLQIRANMLLANRMGTRAVMQTDIPMSERMGTRVSKNCCKRVSISYVSWTGNRVPSYYGRHDSARRDSARRPAEGRQR